MFYFNNTHMFLIGRFPFELRRGWAGQTQSVSTVGSPYASGTATTDLRHSAVCRGNSEAVVPAPGRFDLNGWLITRRRSGMQEGKAYVPVHAGVGTEYRNLQISPVRLYSGFDEIWLWTPYERSGRDYFCQRL